MYEIRFLSFADALYFHSNYSCEYVIPTFNINREAIFRKLDVFAELVKPWTIKTTGFDGSTSSQHSPILNSLPSGLCLKERWI